MIPSNRTFNGKSIVEIDGIKYYRFCNLEISGSFSLRFRFLSRCSINRQAIMLFFSKPFKGKLFYNSNKLDILSGFKHYLFVEGEEKNNEFVLHGTMDEGYLLIGNASEETGLGFDGGAFGCAFWIEFLTNNCLRFHCNDKEYDDDFDDLIFDIVLEKGENEGLTEKGVKIKGESMS